MINKIINVGFSDQELSDIYHHIKNTPKEKQFQHPNYGHTAYFSWLPENIVDKIINVMQDAIGETLELRELSFARYDLSTGTKPQLYPHFDNPFEEQRFTLDIQVQSTIDWPLVVEEQEFTLSDNEALIFSGTHQIHWRKDAVFGETDFVDMIFCHFSKPGAEKILSEHKESMKIKEQEFLKLYPSKH